MTNSDFVFLFITKRLIPGAIISVLGNIFLPQFHWTLFGGFALIVALSVIYKALGDLS